MEEILKKDLIENPSSLYIKLEKKVDLSEYGYKCPKHGMTLVFIKNKDGYKCCLCSGLYSKRYIEEKQYLNKKNSKKKWLSPNDIEKLRKKWNIKGKIKYDTYKDKLNLRKRIYRAKNPERIRSYQNKWCHQNKERINKKRRARRAEISAEIKEQYNASRREKYKINRDKNPAGQKDRDSINAKQRELYKINREKIRVRKKEWREKNPEKVLARNRRYYEKYKDKINARRRRKLAEKKVQSLTEG